MTPSALPSYLKPLTSSYSETPTSSVQRTQYEDGYVAQKQYISMQLVTKTLVCLVKGRDNRTAFKAWFKSIGRGQDWFLYFDPDDQAEIKARMTSGQYTINSIRSDAYHISFSIESYE